MEIFSDFFYYIIEEVFEQSPTMLYFIMVIIPILICPWFVSLKQRLWILSPIPVYFFLGFLSETNWEIYFAITFFVPIFYYVAWSHFYATLFGRGALFAEE